MLGDGLDKPISPQMTWIGWSHNPEVAGSNPAPATPKGPHTRAFCFLAEQQTSDLVPNLVPIRNANRTDSCGIDLSAVASRDKRGAPLKAAPAWPSAGP